MKKLKLTAALISLCCFFYIHAAAQESFIVTGVVFEKGTNVRVALAEITNKRTKLGVGSNDLGMFQLKASIGDTLLVTKRNLNDQQVVVQGKQDLLVYLIRSSTTLDEVTIVGNNKKQDLADLKRDFKRNGSFYQGKPPLLSYIFTPLTAVYELFGKTPRNARRFGRYAESELKETEIDQYFNQSIIKNNTDLKGPELEKYMLDCRPSYEKAQNWNAYDYIRYIKESSKKFTDTLGKGK